MNAVSKQVEAELLHVSPALRCLARVHESGVHLLRGGDVAQLLGTALEEVLALTEADFGSAHTCDPGGKQLRFAVERARTTGSQSASDSVRAASALSMTVLPLTTTSSDTVGMMRIYACAPRFTDEQQAALDLVAREIADFLEQHRVHQALKQTCILEESVRTSAEAANRRKDQFLATLAHELRQPLWTAVLACEVGRRSLSSSHQDGPYHEIGEQLRQIARLVDDLADVSRIARGSLELRRERLDLRAVVQKGIDTAAAILNARRHEMTVTLGDDPCWVLADCARLKQVVTNLLQNAASYTPPGGQIRITLSKEDGRACLRIRDNGVGIPPAALTRIFDAFERGDERGDSFSLGIGLAVVREVVTLHGGSVRALSEGKGCGSEFLVSLPIAF
jgi:signal transduction histidine kinase